MLNTVEIWNLTIWKPVEGRISNSQVFKWSDFSHGYSFSPNHSKTGHFWPDFKWFWTKWRTFVRISNGWASVFQISSKSGPFATQPLFNHLKSRLVPISDPQWSSNYLLSITIPGLSWNQGVTVQFPENKIQKFLSDEKYLCKAKLNKIHEIFQVQLQQKTLTFYHRWQHCNRAGWKWVFFNF